MGANNCGGHHIPLSRVFMSSWAHYTALCAFMSFKKKTKQNTKSSKTDWELDERHCSERSYSWVLCYCCLLNWIISQKGGFLRPRYGLGERLGQQWFCSFPDPGDVFWKFWKYDQMMRCSLALGHAVNELNQTVMEEVRLDTICTSEPMLTDWIASENLVSLGSCGHVTLLP